jgi:hypothetical protein
LIQVKWTFVQFGYVNPMWCWKPWGSGFGGNYQMRVNENVRSVPHRSAVFNSSLLPVPRFRDGMSPFEEGK